MTVHVVYATKVNVGGWATFTRHLIRVLRLHGEDVKLWKIGNNTEEFSRPFVAGAEEDITYRNAHPETLSALHKSGQVIIAACGKHYVELCEQLMAKGAAMVIHDTAESSNRMKLHKPWVIRKALLGQAEGSVFIRHPYMRHAGGLMQGAGAMRKGAIATSRVDFDKNTRMILDANRLGAKIDIVGFENRLYTKFKIVPDYPEWIQSSGTHSRSGQGNFERLLNAKFMVDLTDIKGDGGGTQYTFLEAWDAGAVPIIGSWWIKPKDDMVSGEGNGVNCISVKDAEHLAWFLKRANRGEYDATYHVLSGQGARQLKKHGAKVIGPQIMEWLNAR